MAESNRAGGAKSLPAAEVFINEEWCKGCQYCVQFCPTGVLAMDRKLAKVVNPEECTGCDICAWICPDFAVKVVKKEDAAK